jgi:hypothetical protein
MWQAQYHRLLALDDPGGVTPTGLQYSPLTYGGKIARCCSAWPACSPAWGWRGLGAPADWQGAAAEVRGGAGGSAEAEAAEGAAAEGRVGE